jgi:hypothetical protein
MPIDNYMNTKETDQIFREFDALPPARRHYPTLQEIAGYPHYENVCSNILAFFFNTTEVHGCGDMFLKSLIRVSGSKIPDGFSNAVQVRREVSTFSNKRLDILIVSDRFLIGIENKIFHLLNNDLEEYAGLLNAEAEKLQVQPVCITGIVLSLHRIQEPGARQKMHDSGFINITYSEFFADLKQNLGQYLPHIHTSYLIHLREFIQTIENLIQPLDMNNPQIQFFKKYETQLLELTRQYREEFDRLSGVLVPKLREAVKDLSEDRFQMRVWEKAWLYYYFQTANGEQICVEAEIKFSGWYLMISVRNRNYSICGEARQENLLKALVLPENLSPARVEYRDQKPLLAVCALEKPIESLAGQLVDLLDGVRKHAESVTA